MSIQQIQFQLQIRICRGNLSYTAVSYTHLDVYKRQVLHELQRGIVVTDHEVCVFAHNVDLPDLLFVELIQEAIRCV